MDFFFCNIPHKNHHYCPLQNVLYIPLLHFNCVLGQYFNFCQILFTCFVNRQLYTLYGIKYPDITFLLSDSCFCFLSKIMWNYSAVFFFGFGLLVFFSCLMGNQSVHWSESSHLNTAVIPLFSLWHLFDHSAFMFLPVWLHDDLACVLSWTDPVWTKPPGWWMITESALSSIVSQRISTSNCRPATQLGLII